jgi:hypothetical protein
MKPHPKLRVRTSKEENELLKGAAIFLGLALLMTVLILGGLIR